MVLRPLLSAMLLCSALAGLPAASRADTSTYTSAISEVDACNQAQYLMPQRAVVKGFQLDTQQNATGVHFACTVSWSNAAKALPSNRPILFPSPVRVPLLGSGWL